jgi:uncharacterized protein
MTIHVAGEFCWNELVTPNVRKAKEFYGKVFDWEFEENKAGDIAITMIKSNKKLVGNIKAKPQKEQNEETLSQWLAYILVENLEHSIERATKHGSTIIKPISQVGELGRYAIITDPDGAHLALWENAKG